MFSLEPHPTPELTGHGEGCFPDRLRPSPPSRGPGNSAPGTGPGRSVPSSVIPATSHGPGHPAAPRGPARDPRATPPAWPPRGRASPPAEVPGPCTRVRSGPGPAPRPRPPPPIASHPPRAARGPAGSTHRRGHAELRARSPGRGARSRAIPSPLQAGARYLRPLRRPPHGYRQRAAAASSPMVRVPAAAAWTGPAPPAPAARSLPGASARLLPAIAGALPPRRPSSNGGASPTWLPRPPIRARGGAARAPPPSSQAPRSALCFRSRRAMWGPQRRANTDGVNAFHSSTLREGGYARQQQQGALGLRVRTNGDQAGVRQTAALPL